MRGVEPQSKMCKSVGITKNISKRVQFRVQNMNSGSPTLQAPVALLGPIPLQVSYPRSSLLFIFVLPVDGHLWSRLSGYPFARDLSLATEQRTG